MRLIFYDLKLQHGTSVFGLTYTNVKDFSQALADAIKAGDQVLDFCRREVKI